MYGLNEQNILIFLIQVFLLLGLARGFGELFRKWKQPPLTAEILVGIVLGPTILGRVFPSLHQAIFPQDVIQQSIFDIVAWLGVLFFLLETGLEIDLSSAWRQKGNALNIATADLIVPMVIAFVPCLFLPDYYLAHPEKRLIFVFFMATVLAISAMPVAARVLRDLNLSKTDLGFLVMSSLTIKDIAGWLIFTVVLGFFREETLEISRVIIILLATIGFTIFALTAGRMFTSRVVSEIKVRRMPEPGSSLTFICLLGLLCGAITQKIGIHALFGFFIAGIMAGDAKALSERTRQTISHMLYAVFVPLFFAGIGLKLDFFRNFSIFLVVFVTVVGTGGRFLGAWLGSLFTSVSKANRLSIAVAHTPGGAMEIVVGLLALQYGLISEPVFVAIVFGAVLSSVIVGPWLSYSIRRRKEVSILEFFSRRAVVDSLRARDRDGAIRELCEVAAEQENMAESESVYSSALKRENVLGTAFEDGVAVPHAQCSSLKEPIVVFGRSLAGIEWNSPDGKPAQFIFLLLTPDGSDEVQVQTLRLIARRMRNPETRDALTRAKDGREIWTVLQKSLSSHHIVKK